MIDKSTFTNDGLKPWSRALAEDIVNKIDIVSFRQLSIDVIAARLRAVRLQGQIEGHDLCQTQIEGQDLCQTLIEKQ